MVSLLSQFCVCLFNFGLLRVRGVHFEGAGKLLAINGKDELYRSQLAFFNLEAAEAAAFIIHFAMQIYTRIVADKKNAFEGAVVFTVKMR